MKSFQTLIICAVACGLFCMTGHAAPANSDSTISNEVWSVFERFVGEKYALEKSLGKKHNVDIPPRVDEFFAAEKRGDWITSSNLFFAIGDRLGRINPDHKALEFEPWGPIHDTYGTYEILHEMNPKFVKMLGRDIGKDIPAGSIYFGGTDTGRFLASAFSESHSEGRPFFTMTQNALADPIYLNYVADMYGDKIKVADTNDTEGCYSNYLAESKVRILHDQKFPNEPRQVKPGEDVHLDSSGKVQVNGQVGVMAINGLITKVIFDKNPTREFYLEESFPLDWMFPQLTPNGAIMKINRAEIPKLTEDTLKQDHEFWTKYSERLVGNWITYDTPVKDLVAFVEKVYVNHDYNGFQGDVDFIQDESAQKAFSKLRSSIAGVYSWRLGQPPSGGVMPPAFVATGENRKLIEREADFAFKQAWAFCPKSPEAIYRYVQLLVNMRRVEDALLVAETGKKIDPENGQFGYLINNLKQISAQSAGMAKPKAQLDAEIAQLEKNIQPGSTNFMQQFDLAQKLVQAGQKERAFQVLDNIAANKQVTLPMVMSVADAFNKLGQPAKLQAALEKLTRLAPDSPEAWYDLAASHATMSQNADAIKSLKTALGLNAERLAQDPKGVDIRTTLAADARFASLRETPEYKALAATP